jgi:hypothetical protein
MENPSLKNKKTGKTKGTKRQRRTGGRVINDTLRAGVPV